jgi:NAD-dependent deacetylase
VEEDVEQSYKDAAVLIKNSKFTSALTGAGISVESGIAPFRGKGGLWEKYDPEEYASIDSFLADPEKVWVMLEELIDLVITAKPNLSHVALAELEEMGLLKSIITQNVDGLHQTAGSKKVIEFHGNNESLRCQDCGKKYPIDEYKRQMPPKCSCGGLLRPDVVLFHEPIPPMVLIDAQEIARQSDVMLVIGTSAVVAPASNMPVITKFSGGSIIEVNIEPTPFTNIADISLFGQSGEILPKLVQNIKDLTD